MVSSSDRVGAAVGDRARPLSLKSLIVMFRLFPAPVPLGLALVRPPALMVTPAAGWIVSNTDGCLLNATARGPADECDLASLPSSSGRCRDPVLAAPLGAWTWPSAASMATWTAVPPPRCSETGWIVPSAENVMSLPCVPRARALALSSRAARSLAELRRLSSTSRTRASIRRRTSLEDCGRRYSILADLTRSAGTGAGGLVAPPVGRAVRIALWVTVGVSIATGSGVGGGSIIISGSALPARTSIGQITGGPSSTGGAAAAFS